MFKLRKVLISASIIFVLSANYLYAAPLFGNLFSRWPRLKYRDVVKPYLKIISPRIGRNISGTPTIILEYWDIGSGINKASLKITAINRGITKNITKYITAKTNYRATCVIPGYDPLEKGRWTILAEVRDLAGNISRTTIWVWVVPDVDELIKLGKQTLVNKNILTANNYFKQAVAIAPNNAEANFYSALTNLSELPQYGEILNLLQDMGFKGPNGVDLTQAHLMDPLGLVKIEPPAALETAEVPASFPRGKDFQEVVRNTIIWQLDWVIADLDKTLKAKNFVSYLEIANPLTGNKKVELDYADAAMLKSLVCVFKAKAYEFLVTNLDADLVELSKMFTDNRLTLEYVLQQYPDLLSVKGEGVVSSVNAKDAYVLSIDSFLNAIDSMAKETDEQSDDLISLNLAAEEYRNQKALFIAQITDIKKSLLSSPDSDFSAKFSQFINLGRYFTEPLDVRRFLDTDAIPYFLRSSILPQLDYTLGNLSKADTSYQELLPPENHFYNDQIYELDFADISAAKLGLKSIRMVSLGWLGYNLNFNPQAVLLDFLKNGNSSINKTLDAYPYFLELSDTHSIDLARDAFNNIVKGYGDMVYAFNHYEDTNQTDDILVPDGFFYDDNRFMVTLTLDGLNSMQRTLLDDDRIGSDEFHVNLGEFFVNKKGLRRFLPKFDENNMPGEFPDNTFGGITDWIIAYDR